MEKGFLKVPTIDHEWKDVADLFENDWNFSNCVCAIDGKHVVMQAPPRAGSSRTPAGGLMVVFSQLLPV